RLARVPEPAGLERAAGLALDAPFVFEALVDAAAPEALEAVERLVARVLVLALAVVDGLAAPPEALARVDPPPLLAAAGLRARGVEPVDCAAGAAASPVPPVAAAPSIRRTASVAAVTIAA